MSNRQTVLVIEDEINITKLLKTILKAHGYNVITATCAKEGKSMTSSYIPDLIILDLGLPDEDGLNTISDLRKWTNIPIIVVSARSDDSDKVSALDSGADDYVTKPFSTDELLARIRTALRHKRTNFEDEFKKTRLFKADGLTVNFDKYEITVDDKTVHLTNIEFKIIELLCKCYGKVLTHDYIMNTIWGPYAHTDNKILRVNMANLRRKIEKNPADPHYIFTEPGVGYRMIEAD